MSTSADPPRAGTREWLGLAVIAIPCLLYSMDLSVLNLAVPQLSADLRPSSSQLLWIVDIYGFLLAGCLITMGTLGDRMGRRRLIMIGAAAFGVASLAAAFAPTAAMLIMARALLGVAAATLAPSTLSLIRNMFLNSRQRTVAIGVWVASFSAGAAIGPLIGGLMLEHFWWGSVFLINVPLMILLLALAPSLLPEFRDPNARRLDVVSAALSLLAVLAIIYGMKRIAGGTQFLLAVPAILAGLVLGAWFVRRQRRLTHPLIDLSLFRSSAFNVALVVNVLGFFVAFGAFFLIAQYLQLVLGLSPLMAGLWSAPSGLAFILGSQLAPPLAARMHPASVIAGGFTVAAIGFCVLTQIERPYALAIVVIGYVILSLGLAPVFTLATDLMIGAAPPERAGAASGLSETSSELGGALGIAVLGSLVTVIYRSLMASVPPDVPHTMAQAARDTLGAAVTIVEDLPVQTGAALLDTARSAFSEGVFVAVIASAVLAAAAAIVTAALLRRTGSARPAVAGE
jgi:DHA2 family multidrug resistance protein-like MFS transporter